MRDSLSRLREGVAYYRTPSAAAEKKVKEGGKVKGNKLTLILEISSHLVGVAFIMVAMENYVLLP